MSYLQVVTIAAFVFIILVIVIVFLIPSEQSKKKKRKKKEQERQVSDEQRKLEDKVARLEGTIHKLRQDIEKFESKEIAQSKNLMLEQAKVKKLQEKLTQERGWQQKEHDASEKKVHEFNKVKQEMIKVQESYTVEHSQNLRIQKELAEKRLEIEGLTEGKRKAELELADTIRKFDAARQECAQLKKDNIELKRKRDDTDWIAVGQYKKIEQDLKEAQKKLQRLERINDEKGP